MHIGAFERAWAVPWRASAQPHNPLIPLAAAFDLTHPSSQPRLDTSQRPQPQYGPVRVASRAQRGPGPPPCLAGPHHSRLKAMRRPGRRHPARASSSAAAGPSWCVQGADANRQRPPGTARVGGRRRGGCSCSRLEAPPAQALPPLPAGRPPPAAAPGPGEQPRTLAARCQAPSRRRGEWREAVCLPAPRSTAPARLITGAGDPADAQGRPGRGASRCLLSSGRPPRRTRLPPTLPPADGPPRRRPAPRRCRTSPSRASCCPCPAPWRMGLAAAWTSRRLRAACSASKIR